MKTTEKIIDLQQQLDRLAPAIAGNRIVPVELSVKYHALQGELVAAMLEDLDYVESLFGVPDENH